MKFDSKCALCQAVKNEKNKYLYEDNWCVIIPTKNKKGHHKRIMIVSKDHNVKEGQSLTRFLTSMFITFCINYFDEEPTFALVESTYASVPEHWHKIACDWYATPEELKQLHYTPHRAIKTNVRWEL
jgi:hypothetical protein